jgi:tetratricopeptide (TPR) repeat protein
MSSVREVDICCANCGIADVDDIKLEECNDCDLVKYCSDKCREVHREEHEEECKNRRLLLHDRKLFTQPDETHLGECPLCFLPLPLRPSKSAFLSCCCQRVCKGCVFAHYKSNKSDDRCPFCREPSPGGKESIRTKQLMKRVKANDPAALRHMGKNRYSEGDYDDALKYFTKAAELGDVDAHFQLGDMYYEGEGVEKDDEKAVYHWEKAAIGGHPYARHLLAICEEGRGNIERAVKHFIIAAKLGFEESMKILWEHYSDGNITKEDLDSTLRTHHAAIGETKSEQRDAAEVAFQGFR